MDEYKRQAREQIRQYRFAVDLTLSDRWSTGFIYRSDQATGRDLEKTIKATYTHQCWNVTFSYTATPLRGPLRMVRGPGRGELLGNATAAGDAPGHGGPNKHNQRGTATFRADSFYAPGKCGGKNRIPGPLRRKALWGVPSTISHARLTG